MIDSRSETFHHEAELLGALLHNPKATWSPCAFLNPEDFAEPKHAALWEAIQMLAGFGHAPPFAELVGVEPTPEMQRTGADAGYIAALAGDWAIYSNTGLRARKIRELSLERLIESAASAKRWDDVAKLREQQRGLNLFGDWPDPAPLPVELPAAEPFPLGALPDSLRPWIADISERLQCPPDYPAVGALVTLAALVGRKVGIRPKRHDDWLVVPNLWGVIVGRPGVLKSPALHEVMKPLMRLEVAAKNEHDLAKADAEAGKAVVEARRKVNDARIRDAIKKGGDPYEIARLSMAGDEAAPTRRRYLVNDSSVEKLGELLNENPNGLLVFRDELLGLLYSLEREGQESSRQFYLEAWNGNARFTYDRIGRGTVDVQACCLSILGSIQPAPLQDYLASAPDDGLMQRFQLAVWPDMEPGWKDIDRWPDKSAKERAWAVYERLDTLTPLAIGAAPAEEGGIFCLRFAPDAQAEFSAWRATLETRLRTEELHPALETALAKYRSLIPSLALLIHLADSPDGGPVTLSALIKACAWGEYLESHARRIYSAQTNAALLGAMRLAEKIKAGAIKSRFTLREVYNNDWSRLNSVEKAQAAASILVDHDWLRSETEQTRGRPRTWYLVNPKATESRS